MQYSLSDHFSYSLLWGSAQENNVHRLLCHLFIIHAFSQYCFVNTGNCGFWFSYFLVFDGFLSKVLEHIMNRLEIWISSHILRLLSSCSFQVNCILLGSFHCALMSSIFQLKSRELLSPAWHSLLCFSLELKRQVSHLSTQTFPSKQKTKFPNKTQGIFRVP